MHAYTILKKCVIYWKITAFPNKAPILNRKVGKEHSVLVTVGDIKVGI